VETINAQAMGKNCPARVSQRSVSALFRFAFSSRRRVAEALVMSMPPPQVLASLPEVQARYVAGAPLIFAACGAEPEASFSVQMAKLAVGLCTGQHCAATSASVEPRMFR
jgi:hypothetical protein